MQNTPLSTYLLQELDLYFKQYLKAITKLDQKIIQKIGKEFSKYCKKHGLNKFSTIISAFNKHSYYDPETCTLTLKGAFTHVKEILEIWHKPHFLLNCIYYCMLSEKYLPNKIRLNLNEWAINGVLPTFKITHLDVEKQSFITVKGLLRKSSVTVPALKLGLYVCKSCGAQHEIAQDLGKYQKPGCSKKCDKKLLILDEINSFFETTQRIQLQDLPENLVAGENTRSIECYLSGKDCDAYYPGTMVSITGVLTKAHLDETRPFLNNFVEVLSITSTSEKEVNVDLEDVKEIKEMVKNPGYWDALIDSFLPEIHGLRHVKTGLLLQLIGGCRKELSNTYLRGDIHILLMGDPGTAKSQILKNMVNIGRGIYTSGSGATSAGLTAAAVKDDFVEGKWALEAGALVLGDGKIVCVDEIDKTKPTDIVAIHEAMEQQTVSVAKAGILATLNARCAVLAAANPKLGRFNSAQNIENQLTLPTPLLSRFDLIFILQDKFDRIEDELTSTHIVKIHKNNRTNNVYCNEFFQKYLKICKTIKPLLTEKSSKILANKYVDIKHSNRTIVVTARQLECMIRLAEAKAKSRLSDVVTEEDALFACRLISTTLLQNEQMNIIDTDLIETGISKKDKALCTKILTSLTGAILSVEDLKSTLGLEQSDIKAAVIKLKKLGYIHEPVMNKYQKI